MCILVAKDVAMEGATKHLFHLNIAQTERLSQNDLQTKLIENVL